MQRSFSSFRPGRTGDSWNPDSIGHSTALPSFGAKTNRLAAVTAVLVFIVQIPVFGNVFIDADEARGHPGFRVQGEYAGMVQTDKDSEPFEAALQVAAYGNNRFKGILYRGSLPDGVRNHDSAKIWTELEGTYEDHVLVLEAPDAPRIRYVLNRFTVLDEDNSYLGHFDRVERESPTLGLEPPEEAVVLFDGGGLDHWDDNTRRDANGLLVEGATTAETYGDMYLHLEAKLGFMPDDEGQRRVNSGIYVQNRYEVQILDTFALPPAINGNGALYNFAEPIVNAGYPPLTWQTYDIFFRAPRFDGEGAKTENARVTVYLNGVLVQDDVELPRGTGMGFLRAEVPRAELYLQSHTGPVRFRNVWLVEDASGAPGMNRLLPDVPVLANEELRLDATDAYRFGPFSIDRNHGGHTGGGFANFLSDGSAASLRWLIDVETPGRYELSIRYALADGNRPLDILVNEDVVEASFDFPATGNWSGWESVSTPVELDRGISSIELRQIDIRGPNVDRIEIRPANRSE